MSVLDELKQETERRKQELSQDEACRVRQEEVYQNQIKPAMQSVFRYLNEMVEHLNFVKPEIPLRYEIPGYGGVGPVVTRDFKISVDSTEQPKFIKLWFTVKSPNDPVFSVSPRPAAEETRKFLEDLRLEFSE